MLDEINVGTPLLDKYKKKPMLTNHNIFRLTNEELKLFFDKNNIQKPDNEGESRVSLNILRDCGYNHGLCRLLNTDMNNGIIGDKVDIERR